ncbi:MAG: monofunctional biosynthetic peptidoglycan transglycosylase [Hyphomicrobiaceae bacterium]|nr:monofunctional biosynthetic peptidoglycan transglycosylase [Hyphomicrobiaceae bacterium]
MPGSNPGPAPFSAPAAQGPTARIEPDFSSLFAASPRALNGDDVQLDGVGFFPTSEVYVPPQQPSLSFGAGHASANSDAWPGLSDGRSAPGAARPKAGWGELVARWAKYMMAAALVWFVAVFLLILTFRFFDPPMSSLMLQRKLMGEDVKHTWVPLAAISPKLVRAVIVSEDGRFCQHWGVDVEAIESAIAKSGDGTPRGASTISMQVAKNLFLWPSKSYVRKVLEVPLTVAIETLWPKRRIMEVYLNIAEWGPGVFGAEEAARHHFRKPARKLSDREASQLAVALPNPIRRDAGKPGPGTRRLAALNMARSRGSSSALTGCVLGSYASN